MSDAEISQLPDAADHPEEEADDPEGDAWWNGP